jgi:signal transduction histidine kinase
VKRKRHSFKDVLPDQVIHKLDRQNAELEHELAKCRAELEQAKRKLEGLPFSLSHELHAPLRAMGGFSHIRLRDHVSKLPAEIQRHLKTIQEEALRTGKLLEELLSSVNSERAL